MKTRMNFKDEVLPEIKAPRPPDCDSELYAGSRQRDGRNHAGMD